MKMREINSFIFCAAVIALAAYGYATGAANNIRVNDDLTPTQDATELNFLST